jgi:CheY-like chemotaxis protein/GNAT superfamily N-acetyltransferase
MNTASMTAQVQSRGPGALSHILVVDDSSTFRLKISKGVRHLGHEVSTAADGMGALKALRDTQFDVVLLDIMMPEMDGFEVLAAMKADDRTKHIPVIVISGLSDTMSNVVRAMELGAEDFLPKSFDPLLLKARITAAVEQSMRRRSKLEVSIRPASQSDMLMLLILVNTAGAGLPLEAWKRSRLGTQSPWERGEQIMRDPGADIYLGNCFIGQTESGGLGGLVFYDAPLSGGPAATPDFAFLKPLQELENLAEGTTHISYLCTIDSWRGEGIGSAMMRFAERRRGPRGMSIIVASSNSGARALYNRSGYSEAARRPMILGDGRPNGEDWILMFKV